MQKQGFGGIMSWTPVRLKQTTEDSAKPESVTRPQENVGFENILSRL